LDIGVLGYIGIVQHKEHSPEVLSISPGTPCILKTLARLILSLYLSLYILKTLARGGLVVKALRY